MSDQDRKFEGKATKRDFESKLIAEHGADNLGASPYREEGRGAEAGTFQNMTLYYSNDVHVGTWIKGSGWINKKSYATKQLKVQTDLSDYLDARDKAESEVTSKSVFFLTDDLGVIPEGEGSERIYVLVERTTVGHIEVSPRVVFNSMDEVESYFAKVG